MTGSPVLPGDLPYRTDEELDDVIGRHDCEICGERLDWEIGEFVREDGEHVIAHAQCGFDFHLCLA